MYGKGQDDTAAIENMSCTKQDIWSAKYILHWLIWSAMTRLFLAGDFSQLLSFDGMYVYSYLSAEFSASLASSSVVCVHPVVKFWGQALLLAAGQCSLENTDIVLHPCSGEFRVPLGSLPYILIHLGSGFPFQSGLLLKPLKPWARPHQGEFKRVWESLCICNSAVWTPGKQKEDGSGQKGSSDCQQGFRSIKVSVGMRSTAMGRQ